MLFLKNSTHHVPTVGQATSTDLDRIVDGLAAVAPLEYIRRRCGLQTSSTSPSDTATTNWVPISLKIDIVAFLSSAKARGPSTPALLRAPRPQVVWLGRSPSRLLTEVGR